MDSVGTVTNVLAKITIIVRGKPVIGAETEEYIQPCEGTNIPIETTLVGDVQVDAGTIHTGGASIAEIFPAGAGRPPLLDRESS